MTMKKDRKPLRQRVAERQAAEREGRRTTGATPVNWRRLAGVTGNTLQVLGLILIIWEILPLIRGVIGARVGWASITVYALIFILGRVIRAAADIARRLDTPSGDRERRP